MTLPTYVATYIGVEIEFDPVKRDKTLAERGLDFLDAPKLFDGRRRRTITDDRFDYGEERRITYARLDDRAVVLVHVERDGVLRVISMRHAHQEEVLYVGLD